MAWSVNCSTPPALPQTIEPVTLTRREVPGTKVTIFDGRAEMPIKVFRYKRGDLGAGDQVSGPAIIYEDETTTFVTASFNAWVDGAGSIVMDRKAEAAE